MYYLHEITSAFFDEPAGNQNPKRLVLATQCFKTSSNEFELQIVQSIEKLKSTVDHEIAIKALKHLFALANTGIFLQDLLDKKSLHEAFENFVPEGGNTANGKIWRYRRGVIRVLFFYDVNRLVILADIVAKRKNELSISEKNQAISVFNDYFRAKRNLQIRMEI